MNKGRIYALLAILMVSAFASVPLASANKEDGIMYYGVGSLVVDLDPHQAWDSASLDVIDQVCEGLFGYDLSDPELAIVPVLAESLGTWNEDATEFTVTLKEGVTFHDGNEFDGNDVAWTFARLNALIDAGESQIAELYEPLAAEYPATPLVIKNVTVVSDYVVTFYLNYPYVPFVPLLCFGGSVILSNESTPVDTLLDVATDTLVGTGPYIYGEATAEALDLLAFEDWHGVRPDEYLEEVLFLYYDDNTAKDQAFLAGELDWVDGSQPEFLDQYIASPIHYVGEQRQGTGISYMGMNTVDINKTMRQAISYAFEYDYVIEEMRQGNAARLTSPVPEGIMYHNPDLNYPTYNLTHARQILIDAGIAPAAAADNIDNDAWWLRTTLENPIATYNYSWNTGNAFRADLGILTRADLELIGIEVVMTGMTWSDYLTKLFAHPWELQLYMIGWGPDYNDPSNFINPLFSNTSSSNGAQVNDPHLQDLMTEGLITTDPEDRRDVYYEIQEYIVEDIMPWVFLFVALGRGIWSTELAGIQRNPMGKIYFATMNWQGTEKTTEPTDDDTTPTDDDTTPTDDDSPGIPGYSFIGLLGAAAIGLGVLLYKKRS
jgi:peptide/nickel transport system substrate-binding protein